MTLRCCPHTPIGIQCTHQSRHSLNHCTISKKTQKKVNTRCTHLARPTNIAAASINVLLLDETASLGTACSCWPRACSCPCPRPAAARMSAPASCLVSAADDILRENEPRFNRNGPRLMLCHQGRCRRLRDDAADVDDDDEEEDKGSVPLSSIMSNCAIGRWCWWWCC